MDSALSSPAATMVTEFGYCPQTPPIYAPVAQLDCSRVTIVEREASSLPSSPHKSVEGSSSPTRKRSRLFGTLRLLSSRYESIADENGSPKSLKKRKSIADLLTFSSSRSRKHDEQHVHPSSPNKRTDATSSPRKKVLQSASASRINRRKSLGDIWGSISSRVSPRRESTSHGHCPDWYEVDCERLTKLNDADETTSPSGAINAATGLTITSVVEATGGTSFTQPPSSIADSGAEVDAYHPQSFREHSVSSSLLWYEESARSPTPKFKDEDELKVTCCLTTNDKDEDQLKVICASTPSRKEEEPNVTGSSTPNNKNEDEPNVTGSSTPNNKDEDEPKAIYSSTPKDKGKQKIVKFSTPIDGQQVKTPDSYLNLLIDACEEPRAPDSYLQELLKAASVVTSARDSPCPRCDSYLKEQLLSVENNDLLYVQDQESSKDAENFSAPPPYTLNDLSKVKLGEVTYGGLRSRRQAPERPEDEIIITVREVSDESSERLSKIGSEFPLREGDRKERYEKLMRKSLPSRRSSDESIEKRVKLTVAKMTKNYHMVTSSEGSWEEAPSRGSEQYDFETDQMEVWDSIILGSRTLQEAQSLQSLRSISSGHRIRLPEVENILQDSIKLRQLSEDTSTEGIRDQLEFAPSASSSRSLQKQGPQPYSLRKQQSSSTMVRVEFPKTMNLAAHAELYETKSKALAALYEYKLGELSNFCTFDPSANTIFAHALESSVPNPAVLRQAGLEVLWLPMQRVVIQMIQLQEKRKDQYELPQNSRQPSTASTKDGMPERKQKYPAADISGLSLNSSTLFAHNEAMVSANLYNFGRHGSQFEPEEAFIMPHSRSSSLQLNPTSPQREEESSIFDDDFFLEVESNVARDFLGSQYSEKSCSSYTSGNHLLPLELFETDLPNELLWSLDGEEQNAKPVKTWPELGKAFLAEHPAQTIRDSDDSEDQDIKPRTRVELGRPCSLERPSQMVQCAEDDQNQDVRPVRTWGKLASAFIAEHQAQYGQSSNGEHKETSGDLAGAEEFSVGSLGRVSPTSPYTEHIEDVSFPKTLSWKIRHSRRPRLSSILAQERWLKLPKRNHFSGSSRSWSQDKNQKRCSSSEDEEEAEPPCFQATREAEQDFGQIPELLNLKHTPAHELSEMRFPVKELMNESSRQTSISFTSYIESERERERLYQTNPSLRSSKVETEANEKEIVTGPCPKIRPAATDGKHGSELVDLLLMAAETIKFESQYAQKLEYDTMNEDDDYGERIGQQQSPVLSVTSDSAPMGRTEHLSSDMTHASPEASEDLRSSSISLPIGFKFTEHRDQLVGKAIPKRQEIANELCGSSAIPIPAGFRFTKHREQIMKSEDSESPIVSWSSSSDPNKTNIDQNKSQEEDEIADQAFLNYVAATSSSYPEESFDDGIFILSEDLVDSKQNIPDKEHQDIAEETGRNETSSEQMHDSPVTECSTSQIRRLRKNILKDCRSRSAALIEHELNKGSINTPCSNDALAGSKGNSSKSKDEKMKRKAGCTEPTSERIGEHQEYPTRRSDLIDPPGRYMFLSRPQPRKIQMDDLNIRAVGKAALQESPAKQEGRVGALVDIFQARGLMPSMKPALHSKASPSSSRSRSGDRPTTPTARIVTPSGSMYHPAGAVCVAAGRPLSRSPIKRVPTPVSPFFRPSSGLSSIDTDMSEMFGEKLERTEKHSVQHAERDPYEEL